MRNHKGAHPRMGATDVCPLITIAGITLEECAELARQLAKRIADELHVPTYCYEAAAFTPRRRDLAVCRAGGYEALPEKMNHEGKAPDFGDRPFDEGVARTGATAVGARDFLIAVNYNLNTTSTHSTNAIAFDVRKGPSGTRRQFARRQTLEGRERQDHNEARYAEGYQGDRLVHRRVPDRPGFDEYHQYFRYAAPRGFRRGLPHHQRTRCA